jgi:hypothetical protein
VVYPRQEWRKDYPLELEKWATIGDEDRPWHIHLNMDEVVQARFVKEPVQDKVTVSDSLIQKVICQCVQILQKCMIVMGI